MFTKARVILLISIISSLCPRASRGQAPSERGVSSDRGVSFERILAADKEPQNWLTYSGTTLSQRYSLLHQIAPGNVKNLELQWVFQARSLEKFEATPLVVDG